MIRVPKHAFPNDAIIPPRSSATQHRVHEGSSSGVRGISHPCARGRKFHMSRNITSEPPTTPRMLTIMAPPECKKNQKPVPNRKPNYALRLQQHHEPTPPERSGLSHRNINVGANFSEIHSDLLRLRGAWMSGVVHSKHEVCQLVKDPGQPENAPLRVILCDDGYDMPHIRQDHNLHPKEGQASTYRHLIDQPLLRPHRVKVHTLEEVVRDRGTDALEVHKALNRSLATLVKTDMEPAEPAVLVDAIASNRDALESYCKGLPPPPGPPVQPGRLDCSILNTLYPMLDPELPKTEKRTEVDTQSFESTKASARPTVQAMRHATSLVTLEALAAAKATGIESRTAPIRPFIEPMQAPYPRPKYTVATSKYPTAMSKPK